MLRAFNLITRRAYHNIRTEDHLKLKLAEKYLLEVVRAQGHEVVYKPGFGYQLQKPPKARGHTRAAFRSSLAAASMLLFLLMIR